jgi:hypothetical protein
MADTSGMRMAFLGCFCLLCIVSVVALILGISSLSQISSLKSGTTTTKATTTLPNPLKTAAPAHGLGHLAPLANVEGRPRAQLRTSLLKNAAAALAAENEADDSVPELVEEKRNVKTVQLARAAPAKKESAQQKPAVKRVLSLQERLRGNKA